MIMLDPIDCRSHIAVKDPLDQNAIIHLNNSSGEFIHDHYVKCHAINGPGL